MCSYSNFPQGILDIIIEYYKKNDEGKVIYSFMTDLDSRNRLLIENSPENYPKTYVFFSTEESAKIYVENYIKLFSENLYGRKLNVHFMENYTEGKILVYTIGDLFQNNRWTFMGNINIIKLGKLHTM